MGSKIHPDLVQSKLFFELDLIPFIGELEVKETENVYNIEKEIDDKDDLRGPLSQVTGKIDHRSDENESQVAIELKRTDFCKEKCLVLLAWHGCDAAIVF